jgi:hypothetical protein
LIKYQESKISAHHNYLVNDLLTPSFVVGDPNTPTGFYFLADLVLPGESTPRISGRLLNENGDLLLELNWNRIRENPAGCVYESLLGGFRIMYSPSEPLLEVRTQNFPYGYLTRIKTRLFDENGDLRMEPLGESIQVHGEAKLILDTPFSFSTK